MELTESFRLQTRQNCIKHQGVKRYNFQLKLQKSYDIDYYWHQRLFTSDLFRYLSLGIGILGEYKELWHFCNPALRLIWGLKKRV